MIKGNVILEFLDDEEDKCRLMSELSYQDDRYQINVKSGLETDGASIPRILWTLIGSPFVGRYRKPAIIHDGLYQSHKLPKVEADLLFLELMKQHGVDPLKRYTIFMGVFIFGWFAYHWKTEDSIKEAGKLVEINGF